MRVVLISLVTLMLSCGQGQQGPRGRSGYDGKSGTSCTVVRVSQGALMTCTDGTESMIYDAQVIQQPCKCAKAKPRRKTCSTPAQN